MPFRSFVVFLWLALAAGFGSSPANAETVRLRSGLCYATAPSDYVPTGEAVAKLRFDCSRAPDYAAYAKGWVWLKIRDASVLRNMPQGWQLTTDQARFTRMIVLIGARAGGFHATTLEPGTIGSQWALGGMLSVTSQISGAQLGEVYVGYLRLDDLSLMRKLNALGPSDLIGLQAAWLGLMGVFTGAILAAFSYNLLIYTGQRLAFQRWYLVWSALAVAYGLTWTNVLAFVVPGFAGPSAVTLDYLLVSGMIAAGNMFFLSLIEEGILPRWLKRYGRVFACLTMTAGIAAAFTPFGPPLLYDRLLNIVFVTSVAGVGIGAVIAVRARSRVVWFYLAGWAPVLSVFALRVCRNFGIVVQDDAIDMITFATLAFEAIALSLAIADRFRLLGRERDAAEHAHNVARIERDTFRRAAQTDYLTGLGNRSAFQQTLRFMCDDPAQSPFMLLLVDVDYLKEINDRLGHDGGDLLLSKVGEGLRAAGGPTARVSRIGGDEFAILLPLQPGAERRVRQALDDLQGATLTHSGRTWALSLSIGAARWPDHAKEPEVLVKNADLALYRAKQEGRRRLQDYEPYLRQDIDTRQTLAQDARNGLESGEFVLFYQPIVDIGSGLVDSYEALLRWHHPTLGTLTPARFGHLLEDRKLGMAIQNKVLDMGLAALRDHPEILPKLCVNFIGAQLDCPNAAVRLLDRIASFGVSPEQLCVEITEDFVLDCDIANTSKALGILHDAGVTVALDDFGTGYASLIHLKHLPFDVLKIDRSFTLSLFEDDGQSEAIIRAIVGLGTALGKQVVAEGIETEAHRARLQEMGCRLGQGYLFAHPAPSLSLFTAAREPRAA